MNKVHLHHWSVRQDDDPFKAPEARTCRLQGIPEDKVGFISTSSIKSTNGREVTTQNTIYILGEIHPEYLKWMNDNGLTLDEENPVKIKKKV